MNIHQIRRYYLRLSGRFCKKHPNKCYPPSSDSIVLANSFADFFTNKIDKIHHGLVERSRDGAVVRALASHQCGPGSIPGLSVICGLSLLLVLVPAPRVFSGYSGFPPSTKTNIFKFQFDLNARTPSNELLELFGASWVNKLHYTKLQITKESACRVFSSRYDGL